MSSFFLISLTACFLHEAPAINRDQVAQWIDDATMETITHANAENTDRALEAWAATQSHFETNMEPALRYYITDQRRVTALEYRIGRIRDLIESQNFDRAEVQALAFLDELADAAAIIPMPPVDALTH